MSAPAAPTETFPALAPAAPPEPAWEREGRRAPRSGFARLLAQAWAPLAIAAAICWVTFEAGGGLEAQTMTTAEIAITIVAGFVAALSILLGRGSGRVFGGTTLGLMLAFTALSALSTIWSVQPDLSWQDAARLLAYSAVIGAAVTLVRAAPRRWSAVLGGVTLAALIVCGYALLTKVFPNRLDASDTYARLQAPFGYWNALGLTAAMGLIGCLWLGARRSGHALLTALAYPGIGLMWVAVLLAYSRGALVALAVGLALWFVIVPVRLRGAAVLLIGGAGAALVVAWDFSRFALTDDGVALAQRVSAGHQLGVLLLAMIVLLTLAGLAIGFRTGRHAPSRLTRRRAGTILLSLPVIAVLAFAGLLAASERGLFGSISHGVHALTDPHAALPSNGPGRLTAVGSVRARYWNEALKIFRDHPGLGTGAMTYEVSRLRYRTEALSVKHAHGFVVQTLADLGLVGLAVMLALLAAWLLAAGRATHPLNRRWKQWRWRSEPAPYSAERIGLLSMVVIVVVFGVHSLVDWTWYVPGDACVALLCAGWVAGRGPLRDRLPSPAELGPLRVGAALAVAIAALLAAWVQWEPQRSVDASNRALTLVEQHDTAGALSAAKTAVSRDPLSAEALFRLAAVQQSAGENAIARGTLVKAVHLQPSNPQTWVALGEYDLRAGNAPSALQEFRAAVYLNPEAVASSTDIAGESELVSLQNDYLQALRATGAG